MALRAFPPWWNAVADAHLLLRLSYRAGFLGKQKDRRRQTASIQPRFAMNQYGLWADAENLQQLLEFRGSWSGIGAQGDVVDQHAGPGCDGVLVLVPRLPGIGSTQVDNRTDTVDSQSSFEDGWRELPAAVKPSTDDLVEIAAGFIGC